VGGGEESGGTEGGMEGGEWKEAGRMTTREARRIKEDKKETIDIGRGEGDEKGRQRVVEEG